MAAEASAGPTLLPGEKKDEKSGTGKFLLAALILTVFGALAGGGGGYFLSRHVEGLVEARVKADNEREQPKVAPKYAGNISLLRLEPILTNLYDPPQVFIRVESSLIFDDSKKIREEDKAVLAAEIAQDTLAYLRTLKLSQIEGFSGLQHLREDLNDRVAIRGQGKVREMILETMVVQ